MSRGGARANAGGRRPGAGRKKGSRDRATYEQRGTISELARAHTATALDTLVSVARTSESDAARVSAATALLNRGYGMPAQPHTGEDGGAVKHVHSIEWIITRSGAPTGDPDI